MGQKRCNLVLVALMIGLVTSHVIAQTFPAEKKDEDKLPAETKKRIAELEKRADAVKAENAALRKRLASLILILGGHAEPSKAEKRVADLSVQISLLDVENRTLKAKLAELKRTLAGGSNKGPAAGKQAPAEGKGLVVKSVLAVLNKMPEDLLPRPGKGWDRWGYPKAKVWITRALCEKQFEAEVFLQYAKVGSYIAASEKWEMTVAFDVPSARFTFHGNRFHIRPYNSRGYGSLEDKIVPVTMYVSEKTAKRFQKLAKGAKLKWRGKTGRAYDYGNYPRMQESTHAGKIAYVISVYIRTQDFIVLEERPATPKLPVPKVTRKTSTNPAASRLKLAKGYIRVGMYDKAEAALKEVIDRYPKSKEVAEAKRLLASLRAGKRKKLE